MTCPSCGAAAQPSDLFCMTCGHPMRPADPTRHLDATVSADLDPAYGAHSPYSHGGTAYPGTVMPAPTYGDTPSHGYGDASSYAPEAPSYAGQAPSYPTEASSYAHQGTQAYGTPGTPYAPLGSGGQGTSYSQSADQVRRDEARWASGSSYPAPNPYAGTPNTVSSGTMLNGRPVGSSNNGGLLKGLGAGIAALFVLLAKAGGALAGLGLFFVKIWFWIWAFHFLFRGGLGVLILLVIVLALAGAFWRSQTA